MSAVELRVSIVDVLGTQVTPTVPFTVPAGTTAAKEIDTRGLRSGWYLLWLTTDDASHAVRMYVHR